MVNLVRKLNECNLKCKRNYRNSHVCFYNIKHEYPINFKNCIYRSRKDSVFILANHACCTLANVELSINNPKVKKYLENILEEYKKCDLEKTESQERVFEISGIVGLLENKTKLEENLKSLEEISASSTNDREINRLVDEEKRLYIDRLKAVENNILQLLVPKEYFDECNDIVFEITAGVGGQEAMLFAKDLFNMYLGYIQYKGWAVDLADCDSTDIGGVRHASLLISGQKVYNYLQFEGGVHRVQRIPATEKSGRVHTSTVTVAVLPQPAEVDVTLQDKDLKIETKRASGAGGQHVNTTDSAVRIVHIPTGIVVECQAERSQIKNKQMAVQQLRAKIYDMQVQKQLKEIQSSRKSQVGSSSRSEKIRTYNFNQDRITDHRLNINAHNMESFLKGGEGLDLMIVQLLQKERNMRIKDFIESLCL